MFRSDFISLSFLSFLSFLSAVLVLLSGTVQAGAVVSCSKVAHKRLDYGDAPDSYGAACHKTKRWQQLGEQWDTDSATNAVDSDDATDDGVLWRTKADGSNTWSNWSSTAALTQGDEVLFKFKVNRSNVGNHAYDELKAWIDWNQDSSWSNTDEVIENNRWYKNKDSNNELDTSSSHFNNSLGTYNSNDTFDVFMKKLMIPLDAVLGETWMRVRVVCSESIARYSVNNIMNPTGYYYQGEVEDYKLTIIAKSKPTLVPEPSTLLIFTLGLLGLGLKRRKAS